MSQTVSDNSSLHDDSQNNPHVDLLNALSALYLGGKYSDLVVTCNDRRWAVHRAVVCSRSGFFDGACSSNFRELRSGVIDLGEDDTDAVEQMMYFFYHLDYLTQHTVPHSAVFRHRASSDARRSPPKKLNLSMIEDPLLTMAGCYNPVSPVLSSSASSEPGSSSPASPSSPHMTDKFPSPKLRSATPPPEILSDSEMDCSSDYDESSSEISEDASHLLLHSRVYALAEKYDIPTLKALARNKFEMAMACFYDSPEFPDAIDEVYSSTIDSDRGLRNIVLDAFRHHPQLRTTSDVAAAIQGSPDLEHELFCLERGIPI